MVNPSAGVSTDPLTGEPLLVTYKRDTIKIASADRQSDGEPAVMYDVRKALS